MMRQRQLQAQAVSVANQASAAQKRGNYAEATRLAKRALQMNTMNAKDTLTVRNNIAAAYSHLCDIAEKRGDIEGALRYLEAAIKYRVDLPGSQFIQGWNSWAARLRAQIASNQDNEAKERKRYQQDESTAVAMRQAFQKFAVSTDAQPLPAASAAQPDSTNAPLGFMNSDVTALNSQTGQGSFGTTVVKNPNLGPPESKAQTTYSSASAQADAAVKDPNCVFDGRPGCAQGTALVFPKSSAQPPPDALSYLIAKNKQASDDPLIATSLKWYLSLDAQVREKQSQIVAIQKQIDSGKGDTKILSVKKATLQNDVKRSKADQATAEKQIKDQAAKLKISIDWQEQPPVGGNGAAVPPAAAAATAMPPE
jgi:hypothetical protein